MPASKKEKSTGIYLKPVSNEEIFDQVLDLENRGELMEVRFNFRQERKRGTRGKAKGTRSER